MRIEGSSTLASVEGSSTPMSVEGSSTPMSVEGNSTLVSVEGSPTLEQCTQRQMPWWRCQRTGRYRTAALARPGNATLRARCRPHRAAAAGVAAAWP